MSRLRRIEQSYRYFFVTTNLAEGIAPFSPSERDQVLSDLHMVRSSHDFLLLAYVIMPDHVHIMIYPRETTLSVVLRDFKKRTAHTLHDFRHCRGPFWQGRFFDFICRRAPDFRSKVEYIHQNPVTAGLAECAEDWPWSSAFAIDTSTRPGVLRPDPIEMPLEANTLLWPAFSR